jgi:hypothetical protein
MRVIPGDPCRLSGAIYPCSALELRVHAALDELEEAGEDDPRVAGKAIANLWLQWLTAPPPELVDALGDPLTLVTDHYQVLDRRALGRALAACPDVQGDPAQGWARLEEPYGELSRTLLAINPGAAPDRLELFARTLPLADEGREWFAQVAGAAVRFVTREIVDPLAAIGRRAARESDLLAESEIPIEVRRELHHRVYRAWADEPIPALDDLTPRQAVRTEAGRRKVERLLRKYEVDELSQARRSGAEPMGFDFLWEAVGLERPGDGESPAGSNDEERAMARTTGSGTCELCGHHDKETALVRHLATCAPAHDAGGAPETLVQLRVSTRGEPRYWLHVEARATSTLERVDALLRRVWLECYS